MSSKKDHVLGGYESSGDALLVNIPVGKIPSVSDIVDRILNPIVETVAPTPEVALKTVDTPVLGQSGVTRTDYLYKTTDEPGLVEDKTWNILTVLVIGFVVYKFILKGK